MHLEEKKYFQLLKNEVAFSLRKKFPEISANIEEWNGRTIEKFQEELLTTVKSSVSTKWFYTHIKGEGGKRLPRIDVLNLLSMYAGYKNWEDFLYQHTKNEISEPVINEEGPGTEKKSAEQPIKEDKSSLVNIVRKAPHPGKWPAFAVVSAVVLMFLISWVIMRKEEKVKCSFCFTEANFHAPLKTGRIEIQVLDEMQSPQAFKCDSNACITFEHKPGKIRFVVKAEYCIADTITRMIGKEPVQETIGLKTDDYALMISIFSNSKVGDWEKRRMQLEKMFSDEAEIFQVYPGDLRGMEMYNKEDFINRMTMPIQSLKNIEVLETKYRGGKITMLRFTIKEN
jgi:hypothetical protein